MGPADFLGRHELVGALEAGPAAGRGALVPQKRACCLGFHFHRGYVPEVLNELHNKDIAVLWVLQTPEGTVAMVRRFEADKPPRDPKPFTFIFPVIHAKWRGERQGNDSEAKAGQTPRGKKAFLRMHDHAEGRKAGEKAKSNIPKSKG